MAYLNATCTNQSFELDLQQYCDNHIKIHSVVVMRGQRHTQIDKKSAIISSIIYLVSIIHKLFSQISCTYRHKTVTDTYIDIEVKK